MNLEPNKHSPRVDFSTRANLEMIYRQSIPYSLVEGRRVLRRFLLNDLISPSSNNEKEEKSAHLIRFALIPVMNSLFI